MFVSGTTLGREQIARPRETAAACNPTNNSPGSVAAGMGELLAELESYPQIPAGVHATGSRGSETEVSESDASLAL